MKIIKQVILCVCVILSSFFFVNEWLAQRNTFLGVKTLKEDVVAQLTAQLEIDNTLADQTVWFENMPLVYEESFDCYFLSVGENPQGSFVASQEVEIYWIGTEVLSDVAQVMAENQTVQMAVIGQESYTIISMKLLTLPLLEIEVETLPENTWDAEQMGVLTLYDPCNVDTGRYTVQMESFALGMRGGSSTSFEKVSYSIELKDMDGTRQEASFLGMRTDDDWDLNAIFSDKSRVRDSACYELFAQLATEQEQQSVYPQTAAYCEVILNGVYYGLCLLVENMDEKQLEVNEETDYVYKVKDHVMTSAAEWDLYFEGSLSYTPTVILKYCPGDEQEGYALIQAYVSQFECTEAWAEQGISLAEVSAWHDIDNLIDCTLFNIALHLEDNDTKNMMLTARAQSDGGYLFEKTYYDFNFSFGDTWSGELDGYYTQEADITYIPMNWLMQALLNGEDSALVGQMLQSRYEVLRKSILSEENLLQTLAVQQETVAASGAYEREILRWDYDVDIEAENQRLTTYVQEALVIVDEYIANLG